MSQRALLLSIKHWIENYTAKKVEDITLGSAHCALCKSYINRWCASCPIKIKTGQVLCDSSPYEKVVKMVRQEEPKDPPSKELRKAMLEELEFLIELYQEAKGKRK